MDQVDRSILKSVDSEALHLHLQCHANLAAAEHDKLTSSTSCSGSLIITDCGEELSRSSGTFEKNVPKVPTGLKVIALLSMVSNHCDFKSIANMEMEEILNINEPSQYLTDFLNAW